MEQAFSAEFYRNEFLNNIFPFWDKYSFDEENGGFFTCFSNDGATMLSTDKFIWSQGRMVFVLSEMIRTKIMPKGLENRIFEAAKNGAEFLMQNCLRKDGSCIFLTDRLGVHKPEGGNSIYADCFVVLGLSHFGRISDNKEAATFAKTLASSIVKRVEEGKIDSDPYPVPKGLLAHGIPMILTNTCRTLADALYELKDKDALLWSEKAYSYACNVVDRFVTSGDTLQEFIKVGDDNAFDDEALLLRYINPGHTLEDCWFLLNEFEIKADKPREQCVYRVMKKTLDMGWDKELGGLLLFADRDGSKPRGNGYQDEPMTKKVESDWGSKLWWVHSEALYSTVKAYCKTGDLQLKEWAERLFEYTFKTFPNRQNDCGEWIQIRNQKGEPENRVVALPVKDPFHISRNLLMLTELLSNREN